MSVSTTQQASMGNKHDRWELFRTTVVDGYTSPLQLWCWRCFARGVVIKPVLGFTTLEACMADAMANGLKDGAVAIVADEVM